MFALNFTPNVKIQFIALYFSFDSYSIPFLYAFEQARYLNY